MYLNYKSLLGLTIADLLKENFLIKHDSCFRFSACTVAKTNQTLLWKIAGQKMKKHLLAPENFVLHRGW